MCARSEHTDPYTTDSLQKSDIFINRVQCYTSVPVGGGGGGRHGRNGMVVGFTTTYAISAYHH